MSYDIIPFIIIIISITIIIFILGRKLPTLRILDVETLAEEKELQTKKKLVQDRLLRKISGLKKAIIVIFKPFFSSINKLTGNFYKKILELEEAYSRAKKIAVQNQGVESEINRLSAQADELISQKKYSEAEDKYIKILKLDTKNLSAYERLAEIYTLNKDYFKAKATYNYILKLLQSKKLPAGISSDNIKHSLACCFSNLGEVSHLMGNNKAALGYFKKACNLEPNNPRFLDFLLKISIIVKDKKLAIQTVKSLKEADPENKKLAELEKEVGGLSEK